MKNKYSNIDLSKYEKGYQTSDEVRLAQKKKETAENAVSNYGAFKWDKQDAYDQAVKAVTDRKAFSYDVTGDALYQQYKDNYISQGKQAMTDVMGQASAMTGGYGNSYAATVGNQTYQNYLQGLNDMVPELYQLALERYNAEGERLANNYNLLAAERTNAWNEYEYGYDQLLADREYASGNYDTTFNRDYAMWSDYRDSDTSQYWNEYNAGYQAEQDALARELAIAQFEEQKRAAAVDEALTQQQWEEQLRATAASEALAREEFEEQKRATAVAEKLEQEQWNYTKSQPAEVSYAITSYSDIPKSIRSSLDEMVAPLADETFVEPFSEKQISAITEKINSYISGMVNSGEMSPAVGNVLMEEYMNIVSKRK